MGRLLSVFWYVAAAAVGVTAGMIIDYRVLTIPAMNGREACEDTLHEVGGALKACSNYLGQCVNHVEEQAIALDNCEHRLGTCINNSPVCSKGNKK